MGPKLNPLLILALFALAVFLGWRNEQRIAATRGQFIVEEIGDDRVVFSWTGAIEFPMAQRLAEKFDAWKGEARHIVIDLNSPGGALAEGHAVIAIIDEMKRTHQVETRVRRRRKCLSMCVPIFLHGAPRVAAASSIWMFHEPSSVDPFTDEAVAIPEFEKRYTSDKFIRLYFENTGVDPVWLDNLKAEWRGKEVWKSGRELMAEGSNIVTVLE